MIGTKQRVGASVIAALFGACDVAHSRDLDPAPTAAAAAARLCGSIDAVRREVEAGHARIRSLQVDYFTHTDAPGFGGDLHVIVAASGGSRMWSQAHTFGGADVDDPVARQVFLEAVPGGPSRWSILYPFQNRYEVWRRPAPPELTEEARAATMLGCLGWWPPDDPSRPPDVNGLPYFLAEMLKSPGCRLRPEPEWVRDRWCAVAELPGRDVARIDIATGLVVRRDLFTAGPSGSRHWEAELDDFRPVAAGIELPYRVRRKLEGPAGSAVVEFTIVGYRVNDLTAEDFRHRPAAGTLVLDADSGRYRQEPGGLKFLDVLVARAREATRPPAEPLAPVDSWPVRAWACLALGLVAYGIARGLALIRGRWAGQAGGGARAPGLVEQAP